jgi:hypothetical protein
MGVCEISCGGRKSMGGGSGSVVFAVAVMVVAIAVAVAVVARVVAAAWAVAVGSGGSGSTTKAIQKHNQLRQKSWLSCFYMVRGARNTFNLS